MEKEVKCNQRISMKTSSMALNGSLAHSGGDPSKYKILAPTPAAQHQPGCGTGKISTQDAAPSCSHRVTTASMEHDGEARRGFGRMGFGFVPSRCPCSSLGSFFSSFSLRCFGCAQHRSTAGASTTGGGAGSARPAATTSSTATTRPRFGRSSASCSIFPAVFSSLSLLFFDLVLFPMISHAMRLLFLLVPGIGLELDCTQNDGHEVDRRAIESVRFVLVRCIVHALFHSLTSSSSPALQVICLVCDTEQPVRIGLDRAYVVNSILISVCSVQQ
jgi:hypothetical protein